jgi:cytosine/adenosine deaminase-related metal-dependent hydrolase
LRRLTARWAITPGESPREFVTLEADRTQLRAVRNATTDEATRALPIVVMPRFINAHTHLEFSGLASPLQPFRPFADWIESVIRFRNESLPGRDAAWHQGILESATCGASVVCDIETLPAVWNDVPHSIDHAFVLREFIGLDRNTIPGQIDEAERLLQANPMPRLHRGLSPHAPYSVHPDLLSGLIDVAIRNNAIVAMHVAETTDEIELLRHGRGQLADFLKRRTLFDSSTFPGGRSVRDILEMLSRCDSALVVHANYLTHEEVDFLGRHPQLTVVWCPRTHAGFGHAPHPVRRLLAAGVRVVLGTDSRASNPDLSMWRELQFAAKQLSDVPFENLLSLVTTEPAKALGLKPEHFRVQHGSPVSNLQWLAAEPKASVCDALAAAHDVHPL